MYVASGIMDIILFVTAMVFSNKIIPQEWLWANIICRVVEVGCLLDLLIIPYIRYCRYQYCITDECIDVKEGFWFIERNIVPIERLHKVQTMRGPIDRMFGLTKVIVTTAGGDVTIRFLEEAEADKIVMNLQRRVNQIIEIQRTEKESQKESKKES